MKTLLEFLEENRISLRDGVYEIAGVDRHLVYNGVSYNTSEYRGFELCADAYVLFNGNISLAQGVNPFQADDKPKNKYNRKCKGVTIDVYDVLKAFEVTDPALQHLIKKALCAGLRGHKNKEQDLIDILDSAKRALELYHDDNASAERSPEVSGVRGCDDNPEAGFKNEDKLYDRVSGYKLLKEIPRS
ncbi:hypothetical protein [Proteus phage vB_PmiP_RS51pmB]|nr:hypothetical protein [Proteus phage vB_PmiP_RS51pmB]